MQIQNIKKIPHYDKPLLERMFVTIAVITLLFSIAMFLFPQIDLAVSSFFYRPQSGFFFKTYYSQLHLDLFRNLLMWLSYSFIIVVSLALILSLFNKKIKQLPTPRICIFLLICFLLGPGLTVNELFKNHWGRARPHQVQQFGGDKIFTPAWVISSQCDKNCSFTSGETANVFCYIALLFVVRRKRLLSAIILAMGLIIAFERIGQGDHFFSDTILSALIDYLLIWLIFNAMNLNANNRREPHESY